MIKEKYHFEKLIDDRYAVWYKELKNKGNKLGLYKIFDLYKSTKVAKFGIRYKARPGQTQEESDNNVINLTTRKFIVKRRDGGNHRQAA